MLSFHGFLEGPEEMMDGFTSLEKKQAALPTLLKEGKSKKEGRPPIRGAAFLNASMPVGAS